MADDINNLGYAGFQSPGYGADAWGAVAFTAQQIMNRICTTTLCKVVKVTNAGELSPAGFIDVQPLVNQVNPAGLPTPHAVIYNIPYLRMQGGANAIILDPVVGDIGYVGFSSHDLSNIIKAKGQANPGSFRRFDMADGVWIGGVLNGAPTQYIQFNTTGIKMVSTNNITLQATNGVDITAPVVRINASGSTTINTPTFTVNGATQLNGAVNASSTIVAAGDVTGNGTSLHSHTHNMPAIANGGVTKPTTGPL
jgi:hypothetical protein